VTPLSVRHGVTFALVPIMHTHFYDKAMTVIGPPHDDVFAMQFDGRHSACQKGQLRWWLEECLEDPS